LPNMSDCSAKNELSALLECARAGETNQEASS